MKAYRGNRCKTPIILDLVTRQMGDQPHATAVLPLGHVPLVPVQQGGGCAPEPL